MKCKFCSSVCIKAGRQKNGTQKYQCKSCKKYQQKYYCYRACTPIVWDEFMRLEDMGAGVRRAAKYLRISINTFQKWVSRAIDIVPEIHFPSGGIYDVDELQTYTGKRERKCWVTYGWNVELGLPIGLKVGGRSSLEISLVINEILDQKPKKINTDRYVVYTNLIPKSIHSRGKRKANHIENKHRHLRKDIAYLIRETMCYAKNVKMLEARIKWYFWGSQNPFFFLK